MTGIDTNVLVALVNATHPAHGATCRLFQREVIASGRPVAITAAVISEFIHVVTDNRRFERPLSMDQALADGEYWWTSRQTCKLHTSPEALALFFRWMREFRLGRKRVLDTLLAATLHAAGVRRLLTANPDDFRVLGAFELLVP